MAASTVISSPRPSHRTARVSQDGAFQGALALDFANGQAVTLSGTSAPVTNAFDASNDRIVMCSVGGASTVVGCWITVDTIPVATAGAGSMWIPQGGPPVPVYVPANMKIAGIQGAAGGTLSMIPALLAGN
jgi:hypothetical protein